MNTALPEGRMPKARDTATVTLAAMTLLNRQAAMKRATSAGSVSTRGWRTKRRTRAGAGVGLQCCAEGDERCRADRPGIEVAVHRREHDVDAERPEQHRAEHRPAIDEHAGERDTGGR